MRVTREKANENRERVIDAASVSLRQHGIDGIGIADLMKEAGLTHGGFYRQFKSKDDLVVQALQKAFVETQNRMSGRLRSTQDDPLRALVELYVSSEHSELVGEGCSLAALGTDAARSKDPALQDLFQRAVQAYLQVIANVLPEGDAETKRRQSIAMLSEMVGALILSRVVQEPALKDEILKSVREDLLEAPVDA